MAAAQLDAISFGIAGTPYRAIQIPLEEDIPLDLIKKIVKHGKERILKTKKPLKNSG